jgi:chorismate mutase
VKALRGAITVAANTPEAIADATGTLLSVLAMRNNLAMDEVISVFFTLTPDLNADFPARAARALGWDAPLLDMVEVDVPEALPCCLRVLIHVDRTERVKHAYLRGARQLRPDLERAAHEE